MNRLAVAASRGGVNIGVSAMIGRSPLRKEDLHLLTGRGRFADDNELSDQVRAVFVASPYAHALIRSIDATAAENAPGVLAALTGADWLSDGLGAIPHNLGFSSPPDIALRNRDGSDRFVAPHYPLPADRARYVGEPVAMVVAETVAEARDAAERIRIDYAPLAAIVDTSKAAEAPAVWPDHGSNVAIDADVNEAAATDGVFNRAAHVVSLQTALSRVSAVAMEPRSSLGVFEEDGRYTLRTTSGSIYRYKTELARLLGTDEGDVRVIVGDVGGSYGPRNALYAEHALVLWAARRLGRPVKWTGDRTECMLTDYQARDLVVDARLAFDRDGRMLAFGTENTSNVGAYTASWIPLVKGIEISTGLYAPGKVSARAIAVQTNTPPTYPYRSAGRPEVMYAIERMIDMAASATGLDRLEIRRRNLIPPDAMPYDNGFRMTYDSGDYPAAMEKAVEASNWRGFESRRREARRRGALRGIGISNYADLSTGYPREWAEIHVRPDGEIDVQIGTMATGQGHRTSFSQMLADLLQVSYEAVNVDYGDTDRLKDGGGSHSGRSMRMGAIVLSDASARIVERGRRIAAVVLEAAETDIEYSRGTFAVAGTDRTVGLFEIARAAADDAEGPLREEADVHLPRAVIGSGCHVAEVEIDPETGAVSVVDWTAVDDVGRAINPMTLDGQTHGGVMQGVGQALMESCAYDAETGQMAGATLMDYAMPRAEDSPPFRTVLLEVPSPSNPLGVKPGSEGGAAVAPAAIANAIVDALSEYGVTHIELPATPERVWRAMRAGSSAAGA